MLLFMECLGVSSAQRLQALSALLSSQKEDDGDEECKVRMNPHFIVDAWSSTFSEKISMN